MCLKTIFGIVAPFCFVWCITNYSYTRALGRVAVTDVTAIFSSCSAFVYIFSLLILKEPFLFIRVSNYAFSSLRLYNSSRLKSLMHAHNILPLHWSVCIPILDMNNQSSGSLAAHLRRRKPKIEKNKIK